MEFYLLIRFLHLLSAIAFVGGIFARQVVRAVAARTDDVRRFAALTEGAGRIETLMVIPGSMAVFVFGVLLALTTGAPIFGVLQGASKNWLLVSNIWLLLGFAVVPLVFVPHGKRFKVALQEALAKGQMTPELRAARENPTVRAAHWGEMIGAVVIVLLMVFRPF